MEQLKSFSENRIQRTSAGLAEGKRRYLNIASYVICCILFGLYALFAVPWLYFAIIGEPVARALLVFLTSYVLVRCALIARKGFMSWLEKRFS